MPNQTSVKPNLGFHIIKDLPASVRKSLTQTLTISSETPTTGITVTKIPNESWFTVPGSINHDVAFDVTAVPPAPEDLYRHSERTMVLRFTKATYDTLDIEVTLKTSPGGPP